MASPARRVGWLFPSLRGFSASWLPGDAIAAMTLAAIAIPEQLATARLAGMPPMSGVFAFAAGSLAFAAFGANRFMSVGADSTIAPIIAATLGGLAAAGTAHYAGMSAALAPPLPSHPPASPAAFSTNIRFKFQAMSQGSIHL